MLYLRICSLKPTESREIEILLSPHQELGFQPKSFNQRPNLEFEGSYVQAQRCTRQLSMIPSTQNLQNFTLMSIGPTHGQKEHKQHITHKLHARSHILITRSSQTPTSYLMLCQSHQVMCPLLDMRLLIGEHHATV
jgi:hypothetical protein